MAIIYKTSRSKFYFARFSDGSGSCKRFARAWGKTANLYFGEIRRILVRAIAALPKL